MLHTAFPPRGVWRSTLHLQAGTRRFQGETESTFGMTYHSHWRAYEEALLRAERVMGWPSLHLRMTNNKTAIIPTTLKGDRVLANWNFWYTQRRTSEFQIFLKNLCGRKKRGSLAEPAVWQKGGPERRRNRGAQEPPWWPCSGGGHGLTLRAPAVSRAPGPACKGLPVYAEFPGLQRPEALNGQLEPESWRGLNGRWLHRGSAFASLERQRRGCCLLCSPIFQHSQTDWAVSLHAQPVQSHVWSTQALSTPTVVVPEA